MSILNNKLRHGNFSSSNIFKLVTNGTAKSENAAIAYVNEKNLERKLGRPLGLNKSTRATLWGHFMELRVHELLPTSYKTTSSVTIPHPTIPFWVGSPDTINVPETTVGDIKAYEPKAFCEYVDMLNQNDYELFKKEYPKEFWQLISNSIHTGCTHIEAINYMPYESELADIREMASNYNEADFYKYRFIAESFSDELPYLPDGGHYKNLNIHRFEVKGEDVELLTSQVLKYGELLINPASTHIVLHDPAVNAIIHDKI